MVNEVYKLLIPLHEAYHRYERLAEIHGALQTAFRNIVANVIVSFSFFRNSA